VYDVSTVGREPLYLREGWGQSMRVPVPRNRIVALTLVGAVLVAAVSVSLAFPGVLPGDDDDKPETVAPDAPSPNQEFTPAVQGTGGDGEDEHEEHEEEGEEYEEYEEHEDGED